MTIEKFLQYIQYEVNLSPLTVKAYKRDLEQFEDFVTAHGKRRWDVASTGTADVRAWVVELSKRGVSPRSVRRKVQALRAYFRWLQREGAIAENPAADVELSKVPKQLPAMVREKNLDTLLDAPLDEADFAAVRDRLVVMMLYETGIRRAELIGLRDADVDTRAASLKVLGKRNKHRIVPFGAELGRLIDDYRHLRAAQCGPTDAFFVTAKGRGLYPSIVYNIVHDSLAQVGGGSKLSPHVLRHTFASSMLNHGAQLNSVKELLGHASLAATQVYTHVTFSELKNNYKLAHPRAQKKEVNHGS
jgi:integrase/recombinase XerC